MHPEHSRDPCLCSTMDRHISSAGAVGPLQVILCKGNQGEEGLNYIIMFLLYIICYISLIYIYILMNKMFEACHMLWRRQHMSSFFFFLREVTFEFLILENFGNQGLWAYFDFWAWERAACHFCSTCCYYVSACCACQSSRFFVLAYFHPPPPIP